MSFHVSCAIITDMAIVYGLANYSF